MSGKKKKFNSRFPPARIKKMMQSDEDVGKVAWVVPCLISKALEIFAEQLMTTISEEIHSRNARTLSTAHIKAAIKLKNEFIAVRELAEGESNGDSGEYSEHTDAGQQSPKKRKSSADDMPVIETPLSVIAPVISQPDEPPKKRGRGRPRKQPVELYTTVMAGQAFTKHSSLERSQSHSGKKNDVFDDDDDDDDEDDDDDDDDDEDYH